MFRHREPLALLREAIVLLEHVEQLAVCLLGEEVVAAGHVEHGSCGRLGAEDAEGVWAQVATGVKTCGTLALFNCCVYL